MQLVAENGNPEHCVEAVDGLEHLGEVVSFCLDILLPNDPVRVCVMYTEDEELEFRVDFVEATNFISYYQIDCNFENLESRAAKEIIAGICHECVHIFQWEREYLVYDENADLNYWLGVPYEETVEAEYWFIPWEVQARGLEHALAAAWFGRFKKNWIEYIDNMEML